MEKKYLKIIGVIFFFIVSLNFIFAAASFAVNSFSCSPSEVVVGASFSCTATIKNNGDASGSVSTATLYSDTNDWLENSNYPQSSGASVGAGQSTEVTFTGLRATKSGNNGFTKIMLDSVTDTYVADNNKKVNVIDVSVSVSKSASSAVMGGTFDASALVTAGGNIDVSLAYATVSGGCTIGSQTNPKTISGMQDGNQQTRTWTITQGSSGDCVFTISASATGDGGIANKVDTSSNTVTCSDCPVSSSSSSSSGGGGGGGGASGAMFLGELIGTKTIDLGSGNKVKFNLSNAEYSLSLVNLSQTFVWISSSFFSENLSMIVGDEKNFDLNNDGKYELNIKLKSTNYLLGKATFILTSFAEPVAGSVSNAGVEENKEKVTESPNTPIFTEENLKKVGIISLKIIIPIAIIFIILSLIGFHRLKKYLDWIYIKKSIKSPEWAKKDFSEKK